MSIVNEETIRKVTLVESLRFDPKVDIEIIGAYLNKRPSQFSVCPSPIPIYRCYFFENEIIVTYLTHLLRREYETFSHIVKASAIHNPHIDLFVITDNEVILKEKINGDILAHLLFRFHHRIAKKYITEEFFLAGGNP